MNRTHHTSRSLLGLTGLVTALLTLAAATPALAMPWPHPGSGTVPLHHRAQPHVIITAGMPGWQTAIIAAAAAMIAAVVAVRIQRLRTARRRRLAPTD
jgi:hypothetical protein